MSVTYGCDRCGETAKEFPGIRDWRTLIWLDDLRQAEANQVGALLCAECVAAVRGFIATNPDQCPDVLDWRPDKTRCTKERGHAGLHENPAYGAWTGLPPSPRACGAAAWNGEVRCTKTSGHQGRHQNDAGYTWEPR